MNEDAAALKKSICGSPVAHPVILGDGRDPRSAGIPEESIDLLITSPPYPNNIDYSEVYKLELWLLGFVENAEDFLRLRHSTLRSHPTYERKQTFPDEFETEIARGGLTPLLGNLLKRLGDPPNAWRASLLKAYFGDLWTAVGNYQRVLKRNGIAVLVVGNSLHGTDEPAVVATDLVLARIAECHGLTPQISIARSMKRRLSGTRE